MTKQNDYLTKIKRLYELKETLKKLDKEYTKKINDLESDLAKDEQLLKNSKTTANLKVRLGDLVSSIAEKINVNIEDIKTNLNYERKFLPLILTETEKAKPIILRLIISAPNKENILNIPVTANLSDIAADGKTLYDHSLIKTQKGYTTIEINQQEKDDIILSFNPKTLQVQKDIVISSVLNCQTTEKQKTLKK